jgi:indolepyruvate ferredoxin oxidoreductase, beta subunit
MSSRGWQAVVAGVGGQGVLFVTRMLAGAVAGEQDQVLISEVHGMAQRGGSVLSHLKVGAFVGPLVAKGRADLLLSLDPGEGLRNLGFLAPGGNLVVNAPGEEFLSEAARDALGGHRVSALYCDATEIARRAGSAKGGNLVLLAAAAAAGMLPQGWGSLKRAVMSATTPQRREQALAMLAAGAEAVS